MDSIKNIISRHIPDYWYLKRKFKKFMGYPLDLKNPTTFNEKLQWLKLYDRRAEYTTFVDKNAVKDYVAKRIGPEYIIPTIGVWDKFDDIDFDSLPSQFVLKCTHDSGGLVVCQDKGALNLAAAREKIEKSLRNNYYYSGREWPYKHVKPQIIAEQYMADGLRDYPAYGFEHVPRMELVYSTLFDGDTLKEAFYDTDRTHHHGLDAVQTLSSSSDHYALLRKLSEALAKRMPFARLDFYKTDEQVFFGEMTCCPQTGFDAFTPDEWDLQLGEWTRLPDARGYRLRTDQYCVMIGNIADRSLDAKALVDYKFFCFDGFAESVMVCTERETGEPKFYFFDQNWELKRYNIRGKEAPEGFTLPKPNCFEEMIAIAEKLSKGIPYVRVDLYCIDELVYFGEMTFYPDSGFDANLLKESDAYWGEMLMLPKRKK